MRHPWLIVALGLALCACQHHQASGNANADDDIGALTDDKAFSPGIVVDDFTQHMKALSSDTLLGRTPGGEAEKRSVDYLIRQFTRMGLVPGNNGRWTQAVPYVSTTVRQPAQVTLAVNGATHPTSLAFGKDMVVGTLDESPHAALKDSPVVFVGYGFKCPLTGMAVRYGATTGHVFDTFLPERATRYTFRFFGTLMVIGLVLLVARWIGVLV